MDFLKTRAFPSFYQDYAPKLIEFFGSWIDWMNEKDNMAYVIDNLSTETDIDESVEKYATSIKDKLLVDYPVEIAADLKLLLKNIFYLYNTKSSIHSYDFLFRCLYNSPAKLLYPKDSILRASDGRWTSPKYLSTSLNIEVDKETGSEPLESYVDFFVRGEQSNATGYVRNITVYTFGRNKLRNCVTLYGVKGMFEENEHIILRNVETDEKIDIPNLVVEFYEEGSGDWDGTKGILDSDMMLQDGFYYQDFSYVIRSKVSIDKWEKLIRTVIHPAGLELFGELMLGEEDDGYTKKYVADLLPGEFKNSTNEDIEHLHRENQALAYLKTWHILFKMYVFDVSVRSNYINWILKSNILAQRHSETMDAWLYYGRYHQKDGFSRVVVDEANALFNRSSVLMFRDDGTLIDPDIIEWATFSFSEDVNSKLGDDERDTKMITGVTLTPSSHVACGEVKNSILTVNEESYLDNNFMLFATQSNPHQSNLVKNLIIKNEYVKPHTQDSYLPIETTSITEKDKVILYKYNEVTGLYENKDDTLWSSITVNDFIRTNGNERQTYGKHSLLKIPEEYIQTNGESHSYSILNRSLNDEHGVVFSYTPKDFKNRIFLNRENSNVDIHYMNYNWCYGERPQSSPDFGSIIIDTNLKSYKISSEDGLDYYKDVYHCVSESEDMSGNIVPIQQSQFTLKLPCKVSKENILFFANGKFSDKFELKPDNVIVIDTTDNDYDALFYIQSDGRVTKDSTGLDFKFFIQWKDVWVSETLDEDGKTKIQTIEYYTQERYSYDVVDNKGNVCYEFEESKQEGELYRLKPVSSSKHPLIVLSNYDVVDESGAKHGYYQEDGFVLPWKGANFYDYKVVWGYNVHATYSMTEDFDGGDKVVYNSIPYQDIVDKATNTIVWRLSTTWSEVQIGKELVTCRKIVNVNNGLVILYLRNDNKIINNAGVIMYTVDGNNIKFGDSVEYVIQSYRIMEDENKNIQYYWTKTIDGGKVTTVPPIQGAEYVPTYISYNYGYLLDENMDVVYYILNNEVKKKPFDLDALYYVQPNNTITNNKFKYEATQVSFAECNSGSIISTSQTNTMKLGDMIISSEIVTELGNIETLALGEFTIKDLLYYIYNTVQSSINSMAELYILSDSNQPRKESNYYEGNNYGRNFIYNLAVLSPFALSKSKILHNHIIDLKDYTKSGVESYDWKLLWFKILHSPVSSMSSYIMKLNSIAQNHSETMDSIFSQGFDELYRFNSMDRDLIYSQKNESSTLLFMDDGSLIDPKNINWGDKKLKIQAKSKYIHSLPLNPDLPYNRIQVINGNPQGTVSLSLDNFYFFNGKKIPSEQITKDKQGKVTISNVTGEVLVFDYHDNLYNSYTFVGGESEVAYITSYDEATRVSKDLWDINGSDFIIKSDGSADRLSRLRFKDLVTTFSGYSVGFHSIQGSDKLTTMKANYPVREDYLLVFVDGLFTTMYRYSSDGTLHLDIPSKESIEVYVLVPNTMNYMDICRVDNDNSFTFSNLRANTIGYNSSINSITKTNMLLTRSDVMFLKRLLERTHMLEQKTEHMSNYSISVSYPDANVMLHYTMDRMLYDGTFNYTDSVSISKHEEFIENELLDEEPDVPIQGAISWSDFEYAHGDMPIYYSESRLNKYATMVFDDRGLLIHPADVEWALMQFNMPQVTKKLTFVCLNPKNPAIYGEFIKTTLKKIPVEAVDKETYIAMSNKVNDVVKELGLDDSPVVEQFTYDTKEFENIGLKNDLYQVIFSTPYYAFFPPEDEFIKDNVMLFVNGKKAFLKYEYDLEGNRVQSIKAREFVISDGYYYLLNGIDDFMIPRNRFKELGSFIEIENIMNAKQLYEQLGNVCGSEDIYILGDDEAVLDLVDGFNEHTKVLFNDTSAKECIVFQFNDDDLDSLIQEYKPDTNTFKLPNRNYEKRNLLVFVNGYRTTDYVISDDKLVLSEVPNTIEIYVFKKYDYLYLDDNKYNSNSYNFITKNIKRSIFF